MYKKISLGMGVLLSLIILVVVVINLSNQSATGEVIANMGEREIREFEIESFTKFEDGKPSPRFSQNEIEVNKGDFVRIKITTTSGSHDFKIDELNVYSETPIGRTTIIEFVAEKEGEFVFYCTKPGHKQNGHWGILRVI